MRIELLLLLIKHYANNPANFILPNYVKGEFTKPSNQQISTNKYDYIITMSRACETACGITANGLLAVIGNSTNTFSTIPHANESIMQNDFNGLMQAITTHGSRSLLDDKNEFLIYQFTLTGDAYQRKAGGGNSVHSIDHIFSIIQYKNESGLFHYCLLQSYAGKQSLLENINASKAQNNHLLDHKEMTNFLNGLKQLVNAKVFNDDIIAFYKKYFQISAIEYKNFNICREVTPISAQDGGPIQDIKPDENRLLLNIQCQKTDMKSVLDNLNTHITSAQQQDAPQIIEIPQNCDNQILQAFNTLIQAPEQQNIAKPIKILFINPYSGKLISKTIARPQLAIIEALQQPKKMTDIKYPASKIETLTELKRLIDEANSITEMQKIFDIACVCVNQHQNSRWDSFWGIHNTSSLREIITIIRDKALKLLLNQAPPLLSHDRENNNPISLNPRIRYFEEAKKMRLFNKHKNNFIVTGAFGRTHALKVIDNEINESRTAAHYMFTFKIN